MTKFISYLRYYNEPRHKALSVMAMESARGYFKGKNFTSVEFQAYQRGFINAYRHAYAKMQLEVRGV